MTQKPTRVRKFDRQRSLEPRDLRKAALHAQIDSQPRPTGRNRASTVVKNAASRQPHEREEPRSLLRGSFRPPKHLSGTSASCNHAAIS